ncbi:MAG TPA: L-2-hydroxyglutarate oxidase [Rhabdochlamydiaceae bacterium]|nr:L-2-hydroxyglutarate oxidase [Rhabdochlamydiaceae bacterium]HSX38657.1 L-2-hydroxyglutarate oxidase [Chlamydiales bacterium]
MSTKGYDFVIIGGGIIGLEIARELKKRRPDASCAILEKEADCGLHASGRNSGVLHAGFYYTEDSLKARFSKVGNQLLKEYCKEKKIPMNHCGKLVVAKNESELAGLQELLKRAKANGVELHLISRQEAEEIEPRVLTFEKALFSPTTASVNPLQVVKALKEDAKREGIAMLTNTSYKGKTNDGVLTTEGPIGANFVINAAGLYADKIAFDFGYSKKYRILPFKGLYLYSEEPTGTLRTNVYPVPDLNYPFLGVHFTLTDTGRIKIGPTAIPALWREQYKGLSRFKTTEFLDIAKRQMKLLFSSTFDFKKLAFEEMQKYMGRKMVSLAGELLKGVHPSQYRHWGKPGIRAQLFDITKNKLETDFVLEGDQNSLHVLNAVSPGFTSALPFAQFVVDQAESLLFTHKSKQYGAIR